MNGSRQSHVDRRIRPLEIRHLVFGSVKRFQHISHGASLWVVFIVAFLCAGLPVEGEAVRPPLPPLNSENFNRMIRDAEVIAIGTVASLSSSKIVQPPLETVTIHVTMKPERILKGSGAMESLEIEESCRQFSREDAGRTPGGDQAGGKSVTAHTAGPAPQVGRYREGARMLLFLKAIQGSAKFHPLGSGDHDAYLGVFQITSDGIRSDSHRFDEVLARKTRSEQGLIDFILSVTGGKK